MPRGMISNDKAINERILKMKKENNAGLFTIMKWLVSWDNFAQLDHQIVLAHILNVFRDNDIKVTRFQIRYCFHKNYKQDYHAPKNSYLQFLYEIIEHEPSNNKGIGASSATFKAHTTTINDNVGESIQTQKKHIFLEEKC